MRSLGISTIDCKVFHNSKTSVERTEYWRLLRILKLVSTNDKRLKMLQSSLEKLPLNILAQIVFDKIKRSHSNTHFANSSSDNFLYRLFFLICNGNSILRQPSDQFKSIAFYLVDHGVDPDYRNVCRSTVLEYVCSQNYRWITRNPHAKRKLLSIFYHLFSRGNTNVNIFSRKWGGNLYLNFIQDKLDLCEIYYEELRSEIAIELICLLILKGIDINAVSLCLEDTMMLLFRYYRPGLGKLMLRLVRLFISQGFDLNRRDPEQREILVNSLLNVETSEWDAEFVELVRLLIETGMDVENQYSPLSQIMELANCPMDPYVFPVVSLIVAEVADIYELNEALFVLCIRDKREDLFQILKIVRLFLENGADVCPTFYYKGDVGSPLVHLLTKRLTVDSDQVNNCSTSQMSVHEANCWFKIFHLFYKYRAYVTTSYDVASVLKELSLVCRFYGGHNLLDIVRLVFKHILIIHSSDPSFFTPDELLYPFLNVLENMFQVNHIHSQMYQLFSKHMRIDYLPSPKYLYKIINASIDISSGQKGKRNAVALIQDIQIGKRRRLVL